MKILISNDDGYLAPGIRCLAEFLSELGEITVVAPDRDRSAASNSLTLANPLRANEADNGFIYVDGTPTDCVHLAITGLFSEEPDMVVAGINAGANLGDDVIYSGTVAAAMEGRFMGFPALAFSLVSSNPTHYETAGKAAQILVGRLAKSSLPADTILNVNVPDVPWSEIAGFQSTRLGHRHKSEAVVKMEDPRGRTIYWVGPAGSEQDAGPGTDFHAVKNNYISVTPIQVDLTRYSALQQTADWLSDIQIS